MSSVRATKTVSVVEQKPPLTLVDPSDDGNLDLFADGAQTDREEALDTTPADLVVYLDSLGVAALDRFSLVRVFRDEFRREVGFYRSKEGGSVSLADAVELATHKTDEKYGAEIFERLLTTSAESIDFDDLHKLWLHSSEDAEYIWQQMKQEARREFMTGHLAATVFEPVDWMRSAWKRAKFLGVRDSFIDEYEPEGGVEIALVDTMAQAYFLQLHWTEESVKRTQASPYRHSCEYEDWERYKKQSAKANKSSMWDGGYWEIPYASELECQEQAVKMADHFSRLFQKTVRQMDNHRLAKAKLRRLSATSSRRSVVEQERQNANEWNEALQQVKQARS
jgi:hypothetical protein